MRSIPLIIAVLASTLGVTLNGAAAGTTDMEPRKVVVQERAFSSVGSLAVESFTGTLQIEAHQGKDVRLRVEGPESLVKALRAEVSEGTLALEGPEISSGSSVSIVQFGNGGAVVSSRVINNGGAGSITIGGSNGSSTIVVNSVSGAHTSSPGSFKVVVELPFGTPVAIDRFVGTAVVRNIGGPTDLTLLSGEAELGEVLDARLKIAGSGSLSVAQVTGSLSIEVTGSGDVQVMDGEISDLAVSVAGAGDVSVGGRAQRAELNLTGAGRLHVAEVVERPRRSVTGAGDVSVGNW